MTRDPERLLSGHGAASALERELLSSLLTESPPAGARDAAWAGVTRQVALLGVASTAASLSASTTAAATQGTAELAASGLKAALLAPKALLIKAGLMLGLTAAGIGGLALYANEPQNPVIEARGTLLKPPAPRTVTAKAPEQTQPNISTMPEEREAPEPRERRAATTDAERATLLNRESALLIRARSELRAGDVTAARASLGELERRFPRGMLAQEREVLRIELLAAQGDLNSARQRAKAFVRAYPTSPHSGKLERFLTEP